MPDAPDWNPLIAHRRRRLDQPGEDTIRDHIERWQKLLASEDAMPDEQLDNELVKLLEEIHHDF